ncbi:hypothetical protein [Dyadobacter sp. LHD-138]|uniref:hypothetical protein n=1 Tax=Dyadobacter sp. LHD-138 TaxID=3071413 RepID=UPI0027E160F2|nr:hypothetical protein [Dyadobacter sp. LHD-138]MDQ6476849.1 hypothetical protein [Dyadobacter sp. LHD-138]
MKKLLVFDRKRNNRELLVGMLQTHQPAVPIEEAESISEVLRKLAIGKPAPVERNHDNLLIIGLSAPDPEILNFVIYLGKNKPGLKVLLYASSNYVWLEKLNVITCGLLAPPFCTVTVQLNESVQKMLNKQRVIEEMAV